MEKLEKIIENLIEADNSKNALKALEGLTDKELKGIILGLLKATNILADKIDDQQQMIKDVLYSNMELLDKQKGRDGHEA